VRKCDVTFTSRLGWNARAGAMMESEPALSK
jgi:hypothetical protein